MKARFVVRVVEDRGPKVPRRYFLTGWTPPIETDASTPSAVEEVIWETQLNATPGDFSFGCGHTDRDGPYPGETGVILVDEKRASHWEVGEIVDIDINAVGKE